MQCCLLIVSNALTDSTAAKGIYALESSKPMTRRHQVKKVFTLQSLDAVPGGTAPNFHR